MKVQFGNELDIKIIRAIEQLQADENAIAEIQSRCEHLYGLFGRLGLSKRDLESACKLSGEMGFDLYHARVQLKKLGYV